MFFFLLFYARFFGGVGDVGAANVFRLAETIDLSIVD